MHTTIKCYKSGLSTPENLLLSIYQHTTACRCGEKFVLIGIGGHQRGFELGTNVIWFLFNKITVEDRPQGFRIRSREMDQEATTVHQVKRDGDPINRGAEEEAVLIPCSIFLVFLPLTLCLACQQSDSTGWENIFSQKEGGLWNQWAQVQILDPLLNSIPWGNYLT